MQVKCESTGCTAEIMFKQRGWSTKTSELNSVEAIIKDRDDIECFKITGRFVDVLFAEDLQSGDVWPLFNAPVKPQNNEKMFGMNLFALQMLVMPDSLRAKLPPTDCRFRPDMLAWEKADVDLATDEKNRMENNQRSRRKAIREILKNEGIEYDQSDERTFYTPHFFEKIEHASQDGKKNYTFKPKRMD